MIVNAVQMRRLGEAMLKAGGVPDEEVEITMEIFIDTSLRGVDSHGVRRIPEIIREIRAGEVKPGASAKVLRDTATTAMWDAGDVSGLVVAKQAMEKAIEKARAYKIGSVGTMGNGNQGALYWYTELAVKNDMIGVVLQRGGGHRAAPFGGVEGRLGTNPLAIGVPAGKERPIFLDMATNAVASGHFLVMGMGGEKLPEGWVISSDGRWVTEYDREAVRKGRMSPVSFGGVTTEYKGYGIKVAIEAIVGAIGVGCSLDTTYRHGCLYMAIDPTGYCSIEDFKGRVDSMIRHIKSSAKRPGVKEIFLPGEREFIEKEKRGREGIFVHEEFWKDIVETAAELGVDVDKYVKG